MTQPNLSSEEVGRRGEEIYERELRRRFETEENIGRLISIDIDTHDFEISDDEHHIEAAMRLHAKHPGAAVYTKRIGYNAVVAIGGSLQRIVP